MYLRQPRRNRVGKQKSIETSEQNWKMMCDLDEDYACKHITHVQKLNSNFINSTADAKIRDKRIEKKKMTVKLLMDALDKIAMTTLTAKNLLHITELNEKTKYKDSRSGT